MKQRNRRHKNKLTKKERKKERKKYQNEET